MAGGLIEGFQKLFKGKNVWAKHMMLLLLCSISGGATFIIETIEGSIALKIVLFLVSMIASLVLLAYTTQFTHNAIKFCEYRDNEENTEKVKAIQIMPKFDSNLFNHIGQIIGFYLLWGIVMLCICLLMCIPLLNILLCIPFIIFNIVLIFTWPRLITRFADSFKITENVSLIKVFTYLPKVFLPMLWLIVRLLLIWIPVIAIFALIMYVAKDNVVILGITALLYAYCMMLITYAYNYELANIYYSKIKIEEDL